MKVSLKEYAQIHELNYTTVRSYVHRGKLKIIGKDHRYTYVDSEDVVSPWYVKEFGKQPALSDILRHMKDRCYNPNNRRYNVYGGKGIKVCDEWLKSSKNFIEWAYANGYKKGLSIDRIDPDGDYCPENCQWLSVSANSRKKRTDNEKKKRDAF